MPAQIVFISEENMKKLWLLVLILLILVSGSTLYILKQSSIKLVKTQPDSDPYAMIPTSNLPVGLKLDRLDKDIYSGPGAIQSARGTYSIGSEFAVIAIIKFNNFTNANNTLNNFIREESQKNTIIESELIDSKVVTKIKTLPVQNETKKLYTVVWGHKKYWFMIISSQQYITLELVKKISY